MRIQSRFLVRQVERRHKASFGAAGLGTSQSWFWSRHKAGFGAVCLGSAQSRFGTGWAQSRLWCGRFRVGTKPVLVRQVSTYIYKVCMYIYIYIVYIYIYTMYIFICLLTCRTKTGFVPSHNLPHQSRLCAYAQPAAPNPALCLCETCCTKTGFVPSLNLLWLSRFGFSSPCTGFNLSIWYYSGSIFTRFRTNPVLLLR